MQQSALITKNGCELQVRKKAMSFLTMNQKQFGEQALIEGGAKRSESLRRTKQPTKTIFLYDKRSDITNSRIKSQTKILVCPAHY